MGKIKIVPKSDVLNKMIEDPSDVLIGLVNEKINKAAESGKRSIDISIDEGLTQKNYLLLSEKIRAAGYDVFNQYANGNIFRLDVEW